MGECYYSSHNQTFTVSTQRELTVTVGYRNSTAGNHLCQYYAGPMASNETIRFDCEYPIYGRFVFIQRIGNSIRKSLSLCEVAVFGDGKCINETIFMSISTYPLSVVEPMILPTLIPNSWGQYGVHLGPTGPRWAPFCPHELCYLGTEITRNLDRYDGISIDHGSVLVCQLSDISLTTMVIAAEISNYIYIYSVLL